MYNYKGLIIRVKSILSFNPGKLTSETDEQLPSGSKKAKLRMDNADCEVPVKMTIVHFKLNWFSIVIAHEVCGGLSGN